MEFSLTQDHQLLSETARKVGEEFGLEYWRALDAKKEFAFDFWQKVCAMGLAGAALPEEYGGSGLGMGALIQRLVAPQYRHLGLFQHQL